MQKCIPWVKISVKAGKFKNKKQDTQSHNTEWVLQILKGPRPPCWIVFSLSKVHWLVP